MAKSLHSNIRRRRGTISFSDHPITIYITHTEKGKGGKDGNTLRARKEEEHNISAKGMWSNYKETERKEEHS